MNLKEALAAAVAPAQEQMEEVNDTTRKVKGDKYAKLVIATAQCLHIIDAQSRTTGFDASLRERLEVEILYLAALGLPEEQRKSNEFPHDVVTQLNLARAATKAARAVLRKAE